MGFAMVSRNVGTILITVRETIVAILTHFLNVTNIPCHRIIPLFRVVQTMTKLIRIINRICRNNPVFFIGGFFLTGLCLGTQLFSGSPEQHPVGITTQNQPMEQPTENNAHQNMEKEQAPLLGQGVMFFDMENQLVRKVDSFVFVPPTPMDFDPSEFAGTEPKRLRFRIPDFVPQNVQVSMTQPGVGINDTIMAMAEQANETFNNRTNAAANTSAIPAMSIANRHISVY